MSLYSYMRHLTAQQIYQALKDQKLTEHIGGIHLELMGVGVDVNDKSSIGYLFQEWFALWMKKNNIYFRVKPNSQDFPDFLLDEKSDAKDLLEIKVFDVDGGPNFDVANFEAYCRSLKTKSYRVDADYLIFAYRLKDAKLQIVDFWLKKIWDITGPSATYDIRTQNKQGMIYNIRPIMWFAKRAKYQAFGNKKAFLEALHKTLMAYGHTAERSIDWLKDVNENYLSFDSSDLINRIGK